MHGLGRAEGSRNGIEYEWSNGAIRSIVLGRKEGVDKGQHVEAGKHHSDSYPDALMQSMGSTDKAEEMKKMDRGGVEGG